MPSPISPPIIAGATLLRACAGGEIATVAANNPATVNRAQTPMASSLVEEDGP